MYQTKGIVLRKYDIGESDRGYILYTKDYGKKQLFVKSARKIKSKLSGN
ncbi:DNA repair protein RecO, partial [Patescibacteria group bacterium]